MAKLADARRSLEKAKRSALERLQQIEDERNEIKSSLKSLDAALRALQGNSTKKKRKQTSTVDDFSRIVDQTLRMIGPSTFVELQTTIRQQFDESGTSMPDLESRLQAELSTDRFVLDGDQFRFQSDRE